MKYLRQQHPNIAAELAWRDLQWTKRILLADLYDGRISLADYRRETAELEQRKVAP